MGIYYDLDGIKQRFDCREIIRQDLGTPIGGDAMIRFPCPLHHEQHGDSLRVWKDGWQCFGKCQRGGDVVGWVQAYRNLTFQDACEYLGVQANTSAGPIRPRQPRETVKPYSDPPSDEWQIAAMQVMDEAEATLWADGGAKALAWLKARGLSADTIRSAGLGYLPGHWSQYHALRGLNVPSGILIPWWHKATLWGIKVRLSGGDKKYTQVKGGNIPGSMYWAASPEQRWRTGWGVLPEWPLLVVEGEFDCLTVWQEAKDLINPVTLGASSVRVNTRFKPYIWSASAVYVCMDNDEAGAKAAEKWLEAVPDAQIVHVPQGKDPNEFRLLAGRGAVREWVQGLIQPPAVAPILPAPEPPTLPDAETTISPDDPSQQAWASLQRSMERAYYGY